MIVTHFLFILIWLFSISFFNFWFIKEIPIFFSCPPSLFSFLFLFFCFQFLNFFYSLFFLSFFASPRLFFLLYTYSYSLFLSLPPIILFLLSSTILILFLFLCLLTLFLLSYYLFLSFFPSCSLCLFLPFHPPLSCSSPSSIYLFLFLHCILFSFSFIIKKNLFFFPPIFHSIACQKATNKRK